MPKTIDCTPTWLGLLPAMIAVLEDGSKEGRDLVLSNFRQMAQAADYAVELEKKLKPFGSGYNTLTVAEANKLIYTQDEWTGDWMDQHTVEVYVCKLTGLQIGKLKDGNCWTIAPNDDCTGTLDECIKFLHENL